MIEWISVKDRLPEAFHDVLMWDGYAVVSGYVDNDGDFVSHMWGCEVHATNWMPYPMPPKEAGHD